MIDGCKARQENLSEPRVGAKQKCRCFHLGLPTVVVSENSTDSLLRAVEFPFWGSVIVTRSVCQIVLMALIACCSITTSASAQEQARDAVQHADADHQHAPIFVRSRPVIERLPVQVVRPVDVSISEFGDTLIADATANVLFRISSAGDTSILVRDLPGLNRAVDSPSLGVRLLTAVGSSGRVIAVTDSGHQSTIVELPFLPAGLGTDSAGRLWTTNAANGDVVLCDSDGGFRTVVRLSERGRDVTSDDLGAVVLLQSGKLVSVTAGGATKSMGFVPASATRIRSLKDGSLVALASDDSGRSMLVRPGAESDSWTIFASAPAGTSAFAFDRLGNLTLANPQLRAVTRVTSHFELACPHCGQPVPMIFSMDVPAPQQQARRSF